MFPKPYIVETPEDFSNLIFETDPVLEKFLEPYKIADEISYKRFMARMSIKYDAEYLNSMFKKPSLADLEELLTKKFN